MRSSTRTRSSSSVSWSAPPVIASTMAWELTPAVAEKIERVEPVARLPAEPASSARSMTVVGPEPSVTA